MSDNTAEVSKAIFEIRDLLRLMAEPQIAARDKRLREELQLIIGRSAPKAKAVFAMDGTLTQIEIRKKTGVNQGHLSTLVKQLVKAQLLVGDPKKPMLGISIPSNFFENSNGK
jgi:hypothetical protein